MFIGLVSGCRLLMTLLGVCSIVVGYPLDLVKVRIQTSGSAAQQSVMKLLGKTLTDEGITGLYRGVSAPLIAVTPMFAVSFWSYDLGKKLVRYMDKETDQRNRPLSIEEICMAGVFSAIPTTMIMTPSERLKCLLQVQANEVEKGGKAKYKGLLDCAVQLYREGGIRSIYKGLGATLLRDVPGTIA
jgi:solute carrier family 25 carnitine/acylcarnitine transporter 20/29